MTKENDSKIVKCHIAITVSEKYGLDFLIHDRQAIQQLVEVPLRKAKVNPNPERFKVFGTMNLVYNDDTQESVDLFLMDGNFKREGKYYSTDFKELSERIKSVMDNVRSTTFGRPVQKP